MNLNNLLKKNHLASLVKPKWSRRPEILLCSQVPKPLHGVAPRVVLGSTWWNITRNAAYASTDYHCIACGVHKDSAIFHKWLEAHEVYEIDYMMGRMTYIEAVPLCHSCHSFIHQGRMEALVESGKMPKSKYRTIMEHGRRILKEANLVREPNCEALLADWQDWRLVIGDQEYPPKFKSFEEWSNGFKGD